MAYRRRHGITRSSTFKEENNCSPHGDTSSSSSSAPSSPLSSQRVIGVSGVSDARRHDSPLSSGHSNSPFHSSSQHNLQPHGDTSSSSSSAPSSPLSSQRVIGVSDARRHDSPLSSGHSNSPFHSSSQHNRQPHGDTSSSSYSAPSSPLSSQRVIGVSGARRHDSPLSSGHSNSPFHSSSQNRSSKEGGTILDKKTQDIPETFNLQTTKIETYHEEFWKQNLWEDVKMQSTQPQTIQEHRLKASRDVAIAAAKAKLLLREIKTVKADLTFAKERSCQLQEENKILREASEKGDHPADDDMILLQLETLLAEKARLAHENSVYVRENSCLREIIKYHKLSMQDVVYLDEGIEEVAEVNPSISRTLSVSPPRISFATEETESFDEPT